MKLKIEHLNCHFGKKRVLDNLSLQVNSGEIIHLVGANGSGKSTLLKVIIGAVPFSQGKVILNPETYVGALIENPQFFEYQSARDNIEYLAKLRHHLDRAYFKQLFSDFDLDYNDRTRIKKYSLGMRQKVGIIQAFMEHQDLILLDEPTRGLDKASLKVFANYIKQLAATQKAIIIASHDQLEEIPFTQT